MISPYGTVSNGVSYVNQILFSSLFFVIIDSNESYK